MSALPPIADMCSATRDPKADIAAHQHPRRSVMTARNSSRPIARVFRATAAPGCRDELLQRFHSSSAALVNSKVGCLKYRILEPVDALAPEVVFEAIWRDLDAVKVAFGDAWQQSHLPNSHSAPTTAYSVHHFFVSESPNGRHVRSWNGPAVLLPRQQGKLA